MKSLRDSPQFTTQCRSCLTELKAADLSYIVDHYPEAFQSNPDRYNDLKWRMYRLLIEEDKLETSDLRD